METFWEDCGVNRRKYLFLPSITGPVSPRTAAFSVNRCIMGMLGLEHRGQVRNYWWCWEYIPSDIMKMCVILQC